MIINMLYDKDILKKQESQIRQTLNAKGLRRVTLDAGLLSRFLRRACRSRLQVEVGAWHFSGGCARGKMPGATHTCTMPPISLVGRRRSGDLEQPKQLTQTKHTTKFMLEGKQHTKTTLLLLWLSLSTRKNG